MPRDASACRASGSGSSARSPGGASEHDASEDQEAHPKGQNVTAMHPALSREPSILVGGAWRPIPGDRLKSVNPAHPDHVLWQGTPDVAHVDEGVNAARAALPEWSDWPLERRCDALRAFAERCRARVDDIAGLICDETGKALWDARAEAGILAGKVDITLDTSGNFGMTRVTGYEVALGDTRAGRCWFRPHGVMAVLGPFNFPAHLPNGHIVPALAMGNTVVFKPSDKTPGVGQLLTELLQDALDEVGAPDGVVNLVQGGVEIASPLVAHPDIDAILFTGSWPVGRMILEANLDRPGRMIALELGGNNAAVVMDDADLRQAAIEVARCAFITTGQRCTCTRRLIVHEAVADRVISAVCKAASNLIIDDPRSDHPVFMGPLVTHEAARQVIAAAEAMVAGGAVPLLAPAPISPGTSGASYVSPGVLQVGRFVAHEGSFERDPGADVEVFGPLLRIVVVSDLDGAIEQTNATRYGLAASIFSTSEETIRRFTQEARAGCVNVNAGTAGASSKLPFGGLGLSGNHRPAGAFSLDYCAYPVAGMIESGDAAQISPGMRFEDDWLH